jgi:hypothetical protein
MGARRIAVFIVFVHIALFCAFGLLPSTALAQEAPRRTTTTTKSLYPDPWWLSAAIETAERFRVDIDGKKEDQDDWEPGAYFDFGGLATGSGWLGVGFGYRERIPRTPVRLDIAAQTTYRAYKMIKVQGEVPDLLGGRLDVGLRSTGRDYTQVNFFGVGPDTIDEDRSAYRLRAIDSVGFARYQPVPWAWIEGELGYMGHIRIGRTVGWQETGMLAPEYPNAADTFPEVALLHVATDDQPRYFHAQINAARDTRDNPRFPQDGSFYRVGMATYSDVKLGRFSFNRMEAEALRIHAIGDGTWRVLGYGALVMTVPWRGNDVPFYLMPTLGGGETLKAYRSLRFADRHAAVARVEARVALFPHLDLAGFGEFGGVAPRMSELNLSKYSVGFGVRLRTATNTIARVDFAYGRDGWRVVASMSDPFRLKRLTRWTPPGPYVW